MEGKIVDKWKFDKILYLHDENIGNSGLTYLVKWKYDDKPTCQPESDLEGCRKALINFHAKNSDKPGPPEWVKTRPTHKSVS